MISEEACINGIMMPILLMKKLKPQEKWLSQTHLPSVRDGFGLELALDLVLFFTTSCWLLSKPLVGQLKKQKPRYVVLKSSPS